MTRSIVIGLAIVMISTSGALAAQRAYHHGRYYGSPNNAGGLVGGSSNGTAPMPWAGGPNPYTTGPINPKDHEMRVKNLRDSGYDPKNDYAGGLMRVK